MMIAGSSGSSILTEYLVGKLGYYLPWGVFCGILTAIGSGLISTFTPNTATGKWIGYQILIGAGRGAGFQTVTTHPRVNPTFFY